MLFAGLFTVFTVRMDNTVTLTGQQRPLFEVNGQSLETPWLNLSDSFTLDAGQERLVHFDISNMDNGCWLTTVSLGDLSFYNDPMHQWYGLNVTTENLQLNGVPTTEWTFSPNDTLSFDVKYELHREFVSAEDPYVSNLVITWERSNEAPVALDDNAGTIEHGATVILDAVANDFDLEDDGLTIVSISNPNPTAIDVTITPDNKLEIYNAYGVAGNHVFTFTYTINDGHPGNDATATVTLTCHWSG